MQALPLSAREQFLERWEFLLPWCAQLSGRLGLEGAFSERSALGAYHWLTVRLPRAAPPRAVSAQREALELLSLVAFVDHGAWKRLLLEHCHLRLDDGEEEIDGELWPRLLFQFDAQSLQYSSLAPAALLERFFLASRAHAATRHAPSPRYRDAVDAILALRPASGAAAIPWRIPFAIEATGLWNLSPAKVAAHLNYLLTSLLELQAAQAQGDAIIVSASHPSERWSFSRAKAAPPQRFAHFFSYELEALKLCLGSVNVSEPLPTVLLKLLSAPGIHYSELQLCLQHSTAAWGEADGCASASTDRMTSGLLFSALLAGESVAPTPLRAPFVRTSRVDSVVVQCSQADPWVLACLSAAVAQARGVAKLSLDGFFDAAADTPTTQACKWQWLAFALFRQPSRSSVKHLALSKVRVSEADVAAIFAVIDANWPAVDVSATSSSARPVSPLVQIHKDAVVRLYSMAPHGRKEVCLTIKAAQEVACEAVDVDEKAASEWLDVVVPGFGLGSVRRCDVTLSTGLDTDASGSIEEPTTGLESLTLTLDQDAGADDALAGLLRLVGASLRSLSIMSPVPRHIDVSLLVRACPRLELLCVDSVQIDLDALVREVDAGRATVASLMMMDLRVPGDQIARFAAVLADPASAVARQLKELCLNPEDDEFVASEETVQSLLAVLEKNKRLEYLDVKLPYAMYAQYAKRLLAHHREVLPVEKDRLPHSCKLAFLSVLRTERGDWGLDLHVHRLIFAFAGTCVTRTVCVSFDH